MTNEIIFVRYSKKLPPFNKTIYNQAINFLIIGFIIHNIMVPLFFDGS